MAKKRGKYSLNGVGTRIERHAERVARLVKMNCVTTNQLKNEKRTKH